MLCPPQSHRLSTRCPLSYSQVFLCSTPSRGEERALAARIRTAPRQDMCMRKQAIKVLVLAASGALFSVGVGAQLPEKVGDTPMPSLAPIVKKASPAVVNIATRGTLRESRRN